MILSDTLGSSRHEHHPGQSSQTPVEGGGHRHLPLEGPGIGHQHHQHDPPVKEIIREINRKEKVKQEDKMNKNIILQKKKENSEEQNEENPVSEENEVNEENFEEENQNQIRNSYLRIPGPGTRASPGCLEIPCSKQKFGEMSSSDHPSSSGAIRNFTGVHGSREEGELSGPKCDSSNSILISKQVLGSDSCSCSTAATHCGTVVAGKNVLNCTLGGKTTGGRNLHYNMDNELSLSRPKNSDRFKHPRGLLIPNISK
jgi:hypothetical protein